MEASSLKLGSILDGGRKTADAKNEFIVVEEKIETHELTGNGGQGGQNRDEDDDEMEEPLIVTCGTLIIRAQGSEKQADPEEPLLKKIKNDSSLGSTSQPEKPCDRKTTSDGNFDKSTGSADLLSSSDGKLETTIDKNLSSLEKNVKLAENDSPSSTDNNGQASEIGSLSGLLKRKVRSKVKCEDLKKNAELLLKSSQNLQDQKTVEDALQQDLGLLSDQASSNSPLETSKNDSHDFKTSKNLNKDDPSIHSNELAVANNRLSNSKNDIMSELNDSSFLDSVLRFQDAAEHFSKAIFHDAFDVLMAQSDPKDGAEATRSSAQPQVDDHMVEKRAYSRELTGSNTIDFINNDQQEVVEEEFVCKIAPKLVKHEEEENNLDADARAKNNAEISKEKNTVKDSNWPKVDLFISEGGNDSDKDHPSPPRDNWKTRELANLAKLRDSPKANGSVPDKEKEVRKAVGYELSGEKKEGFGNESLDEVQEEIFACRKTSTCGKEDQLAALGSFDEADQIINQTAFTQELSRGSKAESAELPQEKVTKEIDKSKKTAEECQSGELGTLEPSKEGQVIESASHELTGENKTDFGDAPQELVNEEIFTSKKASICGDNEAKEVTPIREEQINKTVSYELSGENKIHFGDKPQEEIQEEIFICKKTSTCGGNQIRTEAKSDKNHSNGTSQFEENTTKISEEVTSAGIQEKKFQDNDSNHLSRSKKAVFVIGNGEEDDIAFEDPTCEDIHIEAVARSLSNAVDPEEETTFHAHTMPTIFITDADNEAPREPSDQEQIEKILGEQKSEPVGQVDDGWTQIHIKRAHSDSEAPANKSTTSGLEIQELTGDEGLEESLVAGNSSPLVQEVDQVKERKRNSSMPENSRRGLGLEIEELDQESDAEVPDSESLFKEGLGVIEEGEGIFEATELKEPEQGNDVKAGKNFENASTQSDAIPAEEEGDIVVHIAFQRTLEDLATETVKPYQPEASSQLQFFSGAGTDLDLIVSDQQATCNLVVGTCEHIQETDQGILVEEALECHQRNVDDYGNNNGDTQDQGHLQELWQEEENLTLDSSSFIQHAAFCPVEQPSADEMESNLTRNESQQSIGQGTQETIPASFEANITVPQNQFNSDREESKPNELTQVHIVNNVDDQLENGGNILSDYPLEHGSIEQNIEEVATSVQSEHILGSDVPKSLEDNENDHLIQEEANNINQHDIKLLMSKKQDESGRDDSLLEEDDNQQKSYEDDSQNGMSNEDDIYRHPETITQPLTSLSSPQSDTGSTINDFLRFLPLYLCSLVVVWYFFGFNLFIVNFEADPEAAGDDAGGAGQQHPACQTRAGDPQACALDGYVKLSQLP